jgi:hypothetical protein
LTNGFFIAGHLFSSQILCYRKAKLKPNCNQQALFLPAHKNSTHAKPAWVLDFLMELLTGFEPATY